MTCSGIDSREVRLFGDANSIQQIAGSFFGAAVTHEIQSQNPHPFKTKRVRHPTAYFDDRLLLRLEERFAFDFLRGGVQR
jgi:hypothetical protein